MDGRRGGGARHGGACLGLHWSLVAPACIGNGSLRYGPFVDVFLTSHHPTYLCVLTTSPFPQHRHARDEADGEELGTPSKARAHCSLLAQGPVATAPPPEPWRAQGSAAAVLGSLGVLGALLVIAVLSGDPAVLPWAYAALGAGTLHATLALLLPRTLTLGEGALITQVRLLKGRAGRGPRI